jgi:acetyltransferase-like isoleucine patch superfamily enzyme
MNPQANAYLEYMKYYKIHSKSRLQLKFAKLWLLHGLAAKIPIPDIVVRLHRLRGVNIGNNVYIGNDVHLDLLHPNLITIEDYASIGMRTMIFAHAAHWSPFLQKIYPKKTAPVVIKTGAWITPGCVILPGVTVGENSVVATSSVVVKDVEPYTVVAGNPAKLIKTIQKVD